jgi:hypothetical protein
MQRLLLVILPCWGDDRDPLLVRFIPAGRVGVLRGRRTQTVNDQHVARPGQALARQYVDWLAMRSPATW